jgi:hypothetical protein
MPNRRRQSRPRGDQHATRSLTITLLSAEQLKALAEITLEDVEHACAAWRSDAASEFADMLDAKSTGETD